MTKPMLSITGVPRRQENQLSPRSALAARRAWPVARREGPRSIHAHSDRPSTDSPYALRPHARASLAMNRDQASGGVRSTCRVLRGSTDRATWP